MAFFLKKKSGYRTKEAVIWNILCEIWKEINEKNSEKLKFKDVSILIGSLIGSLL